MPKQTPKKNPRSRSKTIRTTKTKVALNTENSSAFTVEHHIGNVIREQRSTNHLTINETVC